MLIVYSTINGLKTIESPRVSYPFRLRMCVRFPNPINWKLSKGLLTWVRVAGLARSPGPISPWVHMTGNFSPVSEMRKGRISLLRVLTRNAKKKAKKANMAKKKNHDFRACHSMAVSLQLNGMLTMWKRQQARQDDTIRSARVHPAFNLCNRAEVFVR